MMNIGTEMGKILINEGQRKIDLTRINVNTKCKMAEKLATPTYVLTNFPLT
jgi:hypothetical protein